MQDLRLKLFNGLNIPIHEALVAIGKDKVEQSLMKVRARPKI